MTVVDLFAGAGGWHVGADLIGLGDVIVGIEQNETAAATLAAAGHEVVVGDVSMLNPRVMFADEVTGLIASPPCQSFSTAGKGLGKLDRPRIERHIDRIAEAGRWLHYSREGWHDPRSPLVLEPLRWALELRPLWVALEQVPAVLPLWERYADVLAGFDYSAVAGVLSAEQYGVPQTRKRAIMCARRPEVASAGEPLLPDPTHQRFVKGKPVDTSPEALPRWVSMAEALGWGMTARPSMTVTGGGAATGGAEPFGNAARAGIRAERNSGRWADAA